MYPMDDEIFELTLDGDAPANQPLEMIKNYLVRQKEYYSIKGAEHRGFVVRGCKISRFKLVRVGYCSTFAGVHNKLVTHGKIPEGQWAMALMAAYPWTDYFRGAIGIADASWNIPFGGSFFPSINGFDGELFFESVHTDIFIDFDEHWRWLVKEKENENR